MAIMRVSPTRMVLMDLKGRAKSAKRGHKLLKEKQDGLMQQFIQVVQKVKEQRKEVEKNLSWGFKKYLIASGWLSEEELLNALSSPGAELNLKVETKNVMSVEVPVFSLEKKGDVKSYGYTTTNALLDQALDSLQDTVEKMVSLAQLEKQAENMALELETTRRRVNALEHKVIPDLEDTVRYIQMKLEESERASIVSMMRMKETLEAGD